MSPMISADDLAMLREAVGPLRDTPCRIMRYAATDDGYGGSTGIWTDLTPSDPYLVRVFSLNQAVIPGVIEERVESDLRWRVALPLDPDPDLAITDRLSILGQTYVITAVLGPTSHELERLVDVETIR